MSKTHFYEVEACQVSTLYLAACLRRSLKDPPSLPLAGLILDLTLAYGIVNKTDARIWKQLTEKWWYQLAMEICSKTRASTTTFSVCYHVLGWSCLRL